MDKSIPIINCPACQVPLNFKSDIKNNIFYLSCNEDCCEYMEITVSLISKEIKAFRLYLNGHFINYNMNKGQKLHISFFNEEMELETSFDENFEPINPFDISKIKRTLENIKFYG